MKHCAGSAFATVERGRSFFRLQALIAAGLAVALLSVTAEPADARYSRRWSERRTPVTKESPPPAIKGPLIIAVSIAGQRLTVYDDGVAIAQAPISTGMSGHSTPTGVFSIIQKNRFHRSNIYSGAPMPFMQRITWSGVALHAGALPGYPASHGCIRLPPEFAARLWGMTKLGARVIVSRHDITPYDITHARLSALEAIAVDRHADALRPGFDTAPDLSIAAAIKTADASASTVATDAAPPSPPATPPSAPALDLPASPIATTPAAGASPDAPATPVAQSDRSVGAAPSAPSPATDSVAPPAATAIVPDAVNQPRETAILPPAEAAEVTSAIDLAMPAVVPSAQPSAEALASTTPLAPAEPPPASLAAFAIDDVFLPPSRPVRPLRQGPITIFVSRKDAKLYVRKRFDPLFSVPVTIVRADEPIGTHVFTAAEAKRDGAGLRWIAMTMPAEPPAAERRRSDRKASRADKPMAGVHRPAAAGATASPVTAAEALDRLDLPADLAERIAALMSAGASLIVSDQGLGPETGLETDFIVLTR